MACLTDTDVAALLDGTLAAAQRAAVEHELATCDACRVLVGACMSATRGSTDGAPAPAAAAPLAPPPSRYRIDRVLGAGGMGVVFAGYDTDLARPVALKAHRQPDDPQARAQLLGEARALAAVRHPHVVAAYAYEQATSFAYLVMEYVDGESLAQRLQRGVLPWPAAVRLFADLADGLAALHAAGLLHRDLKPANILIDRAGAVRLADLGLARLQSADGSRAGTLPYMAPEVLRDGSASAASDQFSLAVVLWEALHGRRPFTGSTAAEIATSIAGPPPVAPRVVPRRLQHVLARALAADPDRRWPSATALAAELRAIAAAPRRRRIAVAVAAGVTSAAVAVVVVTTRPAAPAPSAQARARLACAREHGLRWGMAPTTIDAAHLRALAADDNLDRCAIAIPRRYLGTSPLAMTLRTGGWALTAGDLKTAQALLDGIAAAGLPPDEAHLGPLLAWTRGRTLMDRGRPFEAAALLLESATRATAAGDLDVAARAYIELANAEGVRLAHEPAGLTYAALARDAARRTGDQLLVAVADMVTAGVYSPAPAPPEVVQAVDDAIATLRAAGSSLQLATALSERGYLHGAALRREAAEADLTEAVSLLRAGLGPSHRLTFRAELRLAAARRANGLQVRSVAEHRAQLDHMRAVLGDDDGELDSPTRALAAAQRAAGDYVGARATLQARFAVVVAFEPFGERAAGFHHDLAISAIEDDFPLAEIHARQALEIFRGVLGAEHLRLVSSLTLHGEVLSRLGQFADARLRIDEAISICQRRGETGVELAGVYRAQSAVEYAADNAGAARTAIERAVAILRRELPADHTELGQQLGRLGETCLELRDHPCARTALEESLKINDGQMPPMVIAATEFLLAQTYWRQGERDAARAKARRARTLAADGAEDLVPMIDGWLRHPA